MSAIKMEERRTFPSTVLQVFDKFMQYKLPVPVDPVMDIYRRAFTDKEWWALRYLMQEKRTAVKQDTSFSLFWTDNELGNGNCPHVSFRFPTGTVLPDFGVKITSLPDEVERKVRVWIISVNHFRMLREELSKRLQGMLGNPTGGGTFNWSSRTKKELDPHCTTPGQVFRVWPELQPFFPTRWQAGVRTASMKSRLPAMLGYRMAGKFLSEHNAAPDMFRCESYDTRPEDKKSWDEINEVLRLMAIATDVKSVVGYPTFHGPIA